jgi:Flp pilus assembly protein TadG
MIAARHCHGLRKRLLEFVDDEKGSQTMEFVVLLPLFTSLLLLATDASLLFLRQTTLMDVARDTARAVSRYGMTPAEGEAYALNRAANGQGPVTAEVTIAGGFVTVVLTTSSQGAAPFGIIKFAVGDTLVGTAINTMEPV